MNIVIQIFKMSEETAVIYINLIIYNIINLFIYIDKFEINSIDLSLFKTFIMIKVSKAFKINIVTVASKTFEVGNATAVNLIINITTKLFI